LARLGFLLANVCGEIRGLDSECLAQEAVRMSLASAEAAEARKQALSSTGAYNLRLGRMSWDITGQMGLEYNDNVALREASEQTSDLILRPQANARVFWPVTEQNNLQFNIAAGYSAYLWSSELNRIFVLPGSELSMDLYIGDLWINLHERFSISEDNYQDPTVVGIADYSRLDNAAGVSAVWDLNKIIQKFGYDHVDYIALTSNEGQPSGTSEIFSASTGLAINSGTASGLEIGGGLIHYDSTPTNSSFTDAIDWNVGAFYEAQLSQYIRSRISAGFTEYASSSVNGIRGTGEFSGIYAAVDLNHRINEYLTYRLDFGRTVNFAFYGGTFDVYYARLQAVWKLLRRFSLDTGFDYEFGKEAYTKGEQFNRIGPKLSLGHQFNDKIGATLSYQFYKRDSNIIGRDYSVNAVTVNLNYHF
jgi:hypothetical protein